MWVLADLRHSISRMRERVGKGPKGVMKREGNGSIWYRPIDRRAIDCTNRL
jgi:hypothetical protein